MIWVEAEDVILIHRRIIQTTGGIDGLRDRAGLEAALALHSLQIPLRCAAIRNSNKHIRQLTLFQCQMMTIPL